MSTPRPFLGLDVIDLSDSVAGQFCTRLLADHGANVLLVEGPAGTATRRIAPLVSGAPGESWLFRHLNERKTVSTSDLSPAEVTRLAAGADVVVYDARQEPLRDAVRAAGPRVTCGISPFGGTGSWSDWRGGELLYQAVSGTMHQNGLGGRPPLYGVGQRASYAAGGIAYVEIAALLLRPDLLPRHVDVSVAEVAASMSFNSITQYSYSGFIERRDSRTTPRMILRCRDGWVSLFVWPDRWDAAAKALGFEDLGADPRFASPAERLRNWDAFEQAMGRLFQERSVAEVVQAGQAVKAVVAEAMSPARLLHCPQLRARGFWDGAPPAVRLGPMARYQSSPASGAKPEPHAGAALPLAGIRVLDFTTAWAGPMATRLLAELGAEVVKIEGPSRPDDWRGVWGAHASRYPDSRPGERPYNRNCQFNTQNHDKKSVVLDLKSPAGLDYARRLAAASDVVIANFRSGVLDRLGLGWRALKDANPGLIVVEMSAYGEGGPMSAHVALGPSIELTCGMAWLIGYGDGRPFTTGPAYLDPVGGINGAVAVLTALAARAATGAGSRVEVAQREAAMHWIGEEVLAAIVDGAERRGDGNRRVDMAPHDAFPAAGDDEWVVIAAESDEDFGRLCAAIGQPELAEDPRFHTLAARKRNEDELYELLAGWTRGLGKFAVAERLQAAGVPSAPVMDAADLHESAFLRERGLVQRLDHPDAGSHLYQGVPLHVAGLSLRMRRPAPRFGEHTEQVLREVLGLGAEEIERLEKDGGTAKQPIGSAAA